MMHFLFQLWKSLGGAQLISIWHPGSNTDWRRDASSQLWEKIEFNFASGLSEMIKIISIINVLSVILTNSHIVNLRDHFIILEN